MIASGVGNLQHLAEGVTPKADAVLAAVFSILVSTRWAKQAFMAIRA